MDLHLHQPHLHECKSNPDALVVPCYDGAPVPLRQQEGYDGICILESELYNYLWTWFYTYIDGQDVRICISKLSAEDAALAKKKSCAKSAQLLPEHKLFGCL